MLTDFPDRGRFRCNIFAKVYDLFAHLLRQVPAVQVDLNELQNQTLPHCMLQVLVERPENPIKFFQV